MNDVIKPTIILSLLCPIFIPCIAMNNIFWYFSWELPSIENLINNVDQFLKIQNSFLIERNVEFKVDKKNCIVYVFFDKLTPNSIAYQLFNFNDDIVLNINKKNESLLFDSLDQFVDDFY
jgi:hypothetical protein